MEHTYPTFALTQANSQSQSLLKQFEEMQKGLEPLDNLLEPVESESSNKTMLDESKLDETKIVEVGLECTQRLQEQLSSITNWPQQVQANFDKNDVAKILDSALDVLSQLKESLQHKDLVQAKLLLRCHLQPLLFLCAEACYFWADVYPDSDKMDQYYDEEFADHFRAPSRTQNQPYRYQVSIVVIALNHLDVTRRCIEHLLKYTDFAKLQAELILVDNGSSDGTWEFFRSIPQAKVIRFKHNLKMHTFSIIPWVCEGRYFVLANNDILVAQNWAENILACIKSDPKIAIAAPMTTNTDNGQCDVDSIKTREGEMPPFADPQKLIAWANQHNVSRPALWSERVRIAPTLAIFDSDIVSKIGFGDPLFYSMLYWDDDFSLRVRHHGYRQILCEDTLCYHFGSVTVKDIIPQKSDTLQRPPEHDPNVFGRTLFFKKNNQDAWFHDQTYNRPLVVVMRDAVTDMQHPKVLGLEFGYGDSMLQFKNKMRQDGRECELFNLTMNQDNLADLACVSAHVELGQGKLFKAVRKCFPGQKFDLIALGMNAAWYSTLVLDELMDAVRTRLTPQGKFVLFISNPWYAKRMSCLLEFDLPRNQIVILDPALLPPIVGKYFTHLHTLNAQVKFDNLPEFAQRHFVVAPESLQGLCNCLSNASLVLTCSNARV